MADEDRERLQISLAQVAASSLAAVSAAVVCSFFGVAGTVIGTAATSVVATVGSAIYGYSLRRTRARLRRLHQAGAASPPVTEVVKTWRTQGRRMREAIPLRLLGVGIVAVFVVSIGVITVIELGLGKPLATALGGGGSGDTGFSLAPKTHHSRSTGPTPSPNPSRPASSTPSQQPSSPPATTSAPAPSHSPAPSQTPSNVLSSLLPHSTTGR